MRTALLLLMATCGCVSKPGRPADESRIVVVEATEVGDSPDVVLILRDERSGREFVVYDDYGHGGVAMCPIEPLAAEAE